MPKAKIRDQDLTTNTTTKNFHALGESYGV